MQATLLACLRVRNNLAYPVKIRLVPLFNRRRDDLCDVVWVILLDVLRESRNDIRSRLDHHEQLLVVLDLAFPLVNRRDSGNDVDACGQFLRYWRALFFVLK